MYGSPKGTYVRGYTTTAPLFVTNRLQRAVKEGTVFGQLLVDRKRSLGVGSDS